MGADAIQEVDVGFYLEKVLSYSDQAGSRTVK